MPSIVNAPHDKRGYIAAITSNADAIFAVGGVRSGMLLVSSDAQHFHPRGDFRGGLRSVCAVGDRFLVCGQNGFLAYSDDEGLTWTELPHEGTGCIYDFAAIDGAVLASADGGVLLHIALEGLEVSRIETGASDRLLRVVVNPHGVFVLDAAGELRRAPHLGEPFTLVHRGTAALTRMACTAKGSLLVSGDRGQLHRSTDGGKTFAQIELPVHDDIEGVGAFGDRILAWGGGGLLMLSTDDGRTFASVELPAEAARKTLWSAHAIDGAVLLAGDDGLVLALDPLPSTWTARADRFVPDYPLAPLFEGGPEGFVGERLRAYVAQVNGIPVEPPPPSPARTEDAHAEEDETDTREFQGEDAWKADAIGRARGLWSGDSTDFEAVWGVEAPASLVAFERAVIGANPWRTFNELRLDCAQMSAPTDEATNLFEQLVLNDQLNYLGTALPEAFAGVAGIGSLGNGDTYHLGIPGMSEDSGSKVVFFDHEEHSFSDEFADSLDSLAYLCAITRAADDDAIPAETAAAGYEALRGRVSPSWHFSIDERDQDFEPYETDDRVHRFCFWRSRWLITMFRHDHGGDPADVGQAFIAKFNPALDDETAQQRAEVAKRLAPTAIYAAWRAYIFEEPQLASYLDVCRGHRSRIARDAGRLIEELQGGRKALGRILDWPAKLAAVRALDLDPRRAEAREREAAARRAALEERRAARVSEMQPLSGDVLQPFCHEHARDPSTRTALMAELLERPHLAEAKRAAAFLRDEGYSRNGCLYRDEQHDACRHLADHADTALQLLLAGEFVAPSEREDGEAPPFPAFGFSEIEQMMLRWQHRGTLTPASITFVRQALARAETTERWRISAFANVLARAADPASGDVLAARVRSVPAEGGFETRLHHDDTARDLCAALGKVGAQSHAPVLVDLALSESLMHAPAAASLALARLDPNLADATLLSRLLERTTKVNSHEDTARALLAFGLFAAHRPDDTLRSALEGTESLASSYPDVELARAFAMHALSPAGNREPVVEQLRATITYAGYEPITIHRFVLEFLRDCPEFAADVADLLPELLSTPDAVFRGDVLALLSTLGIEHEPPRPALTWLDVEAMSVDEALAALGDDSLEGRQSLPRRLAAETTNVVRGALEAAMARVIDRAPPEAGANLSRTDDRLLQEITLAFLGQDHVPVALYDRALRHPNRNVKDPILRNPPARPELADAMRVVAAEKYGWQESTARTWLEGQVSS